jgi:hypothetical protein
VLLDEGFHLVTAIVGCEPDELRADLPVEVEFHAAGNDLTLPYFRPVERVERGERHESGAIDR